jgi:hypothetical protein
MCSAGVITTVGEFATEFIQIEPAIVAYFSRKGEKPRRFNNKRLHREALKYHAG